MRVEEGTTIHYFVAVIFSALEDMHVNSSIFTKALAILVSGILALQYIPVTFNGKTVIIQISCCKDLKECCASGVQACATHREHGETGAYSSCQASSDTSDYMMIVSKSVLPEASHVPITFSEVYFSPFNRSLAPQEYNDRLFRPPKAFLHG